MANITEKWRLKQGLFFGICQIAQSLKNSRKPPKLNEIWRNFNLYCGTAIDFRSKVKEILPQLKNSCSKAGGIFQKLKLFCQKLKFTGKFPYQICPKYAEKNLWSKVNVPFLINSVGLCWSQRGIGFLQLDFTKIVYSIIQEHNRLWRLHKRACRLRELYHVSWGGQPSRANVAGRILLRKPGNGIQPSSTGTAHHVLNLDLLQLETVAIL